MVDMTDLTFMELANLYDKQNPETQKWMLENMHLWKEKTRMKNHSGLTKLF